MPKKDGDNYIISETGNWNAADGYSKHKILKPLLKCDYYEDVASFGYESLDEELINYDLPPNDLIRYKAINRLIRELIKLINNSKFALKIGNSKTNVLKYKKQLQEIKKSLPNLLKYKSNSIQKTKTIEIKDYPLFENILEIVSEIKSKINEPLNKNHLIFTDKEEFDPKKFKDNLKKRMEEEG